MNTKCARAGIVAAVLFCSLWAFAWGARAEETKGVVQDGGFGKFRLQDKGGTSWLFYLSRENTVYVPADWRPIVGDEVTVDHIAVQKRNETISQVTKATLVKAGPNTPRIKSPVEVEIVETGRSGCRARVIESNVVVKFSKHRGTKTVPSGWIPAPGEKAVISFTVKPSMAFGITYAMDQMAKAGSGEKSK